MALRLINLMEDDENDRRREVRIQRQRLRDEFNPFEIHEPQFIALYRMPQILVHELLDMIRPFMSDTNISKEIRVLASLSFLAEGTFQRRIGQNYLNCISQTVVSRSIAEFCTIVERHLMEDYIRFPQTRAEMNEIKLGFYEKHRWPGIIGCIDCTHVSIFKPSAEIEHVYLNRHLYHSKNVQLICDSNLKILNVNARYGGSNHDATIWRKSICKAFLHNQYDARALQNIWLLGDSGYPLQPWLMTPIKTPRSAAEDRYNVAHRSIRNCVERLNGVLKSRFRCLGKDRCIKYSPQKVGSIVNTAATLHNFLKFHAYTDYHDLAEPETELNVNDTADVDPSIRLLRLGENIRNEIVINNFTE